MSWSTTVLRMSWCLLVGISDCWLLVVVGCWRLLVVGGCITSDGRKYDLSDPMGSMAFRTPMIVHVKNPTFPQDNREKKRG